MKTNYFIKGILIFLISMLMASCGGDSSSNKNSEDNLISFSGVAIDPEIQDANVFLDINDNGKYDENEPKTITDNLGKYTLNIKKEHIGKSIIVSGGVDSLSKEKFVGELRAITQEKEKENTHITPISTILEHYKKNNKVDIEKAKKEVAKRLDINVEDLRKNIVDKGNEKLLQVSLRIQKVAESIKNAKAGSKVRDVYSKLSTRLKDNDLSSSLEKVIDESLGADTLESAKAKDLDKEIKSIDRRDLSAEGLAITVDNIKNKIKEVKSKDGLNKNLHSQDNIKVSSKENIKKYKLKKTLSKLGLENLDEETKNKILKNDKFDFKKDNLKKTLEKLTNDKSILNEEDRKKIKQEKILSDNRLGKLSKSDKNIIKEKLEKSGFDFTKDSKEKFKKLIEKDSALKQSIKEKIQNKINENKQSVSNNQRPSSSQSSSRPSASSNSGPSGGGGRR